MTLPNSPVSPTIALDQPGIHHGHLVLPHSRDDSAYGAVMIPISVIANGSGPTVLLTGGNHGDEYQGPLALREFIHSVDVSEVTGRIIVVPFMNQPAFAAAKRTSGIDGGNLNRSFPGSPTGTVTEKIADYMARYLIPEADMVMDIHDGGKTLQFVPMAASHVLEDKAAEERNWQAAVAFGAPYAARLVELDMLGMMDAFVEATGKPYLTTEIGGGGTTRPDWMAITARGVRNVLKHWGALAGEVEASPSEVLDFPAEGAYILSSTDGLIEWQIALGESFTAGQTIARIFSVVHLNEAPVLVKATIDGILAMRHYPGLVKLGDAIALQGTVVT